MKKEVLTPCTTRKEWDFFIKKQKENASSQMDFDAQTLSYTAGNSKYIYIYIHICISKKEK